MQNINQRFDLSKSNPLAVVGTTNNTAIATVGSFNLSKDDKKDLIKRMKKTLVPYNGKTIKTNKL